MKPITPPQATIKRVINTTLATSLLCGLLMNTPASAFFGHHKKSKAPKTEQEQPVKTPFEADSKTKTAEKKPLKVRHITTQQWVSKGRQELVNKNYVRAMANFKKALKQDPRNSVAQHQLANAQYLYGNYRAAQKTISQAIRQSPDNAALLLTKAKIADALGEDQAALSNYLAFASLAPNDSSTLKAQWRAKELLSRLDPTLSEEARMYFKALAYLGTGRNAEAIPMLELFLTMHPNNANTHFLIGLGQYQQGELEQAQRHFKTVTKTNPRNPISYLYLGNTYQQLGNTKKANKAWHKFIEKAPYSPKTQQLKRSHQTK